jgi:hypothetical protein
MSEELKDILSNLSPDSNQETLLKYLKEQLDKEEQHKLEKHLLDDDFENDAVEGLQSIENKQGIELTVAALNRDLKKRTEKKKREREKREIKPQWALYFSILILLIIIVLIYIYFSHGLS